MVGLLFLYFFILWGITTPILFNTIPILLDTTILYFYSQTLLKVVFFAHT